MRGSHRTRRGGVRWPLVAVIAILLIVGAGAAWFFFLRDGGGIPFLGDDEPDVPEFSFDVGKVGGVAVTVGETAESDELRGATEGVRETLDSMYVAGFIDPEKWEDGKFPEVLEAFAGTAERRAQRDLANLTLGPDAAQVAFVQPQSGRLAIRFLVDGERAPVAAVATTTFAAGGELDDGRPLIVQHQGRYYMHPDGDRWLIVGYEVDGIVTTGSTEGAAGGATP